MVRQKRFAVLHFKPRLGEEMHPVVDLEKLTYQCASPETIGVIRVESVFLYRRHADAVATPRCGTVVLSRPVQITENPITENLRSEV